MKYLILLIILITSMIVNSCKKADLGCIEGVVIAEGYNGLGDNNPNVLGACTPVVQIKNRNIGVKWRAFLGNQTIEFENCVFITNLDRESAKINQKIYFESFTKDEQFRGWLAICTPPPSKHIIAKNLSLTCTK